MSPLSRYTISIVLLALVSCQAYGSAIKGHAQAPVNEAEKAAKLAAPVPVLESSKRVYNDESLRRPVPPAVSGAEVPVVAESVQPAQSAPVAVQPVQSPVANEVPVAVVPAVVVAPVVQPKEVVSPVYSAPVAPVAQESPLVKDAVLIKEAPVAAKADSASKPAEVDPLPAASERSAQIKAEPVVATVEQPAEVPVVKVEQPAVVVAAQPSVVVVEAQPADKPAVVQIQPEPVAAVVQAAPVEPVQPLQPVQPVQPVQPADDKKVAESVLEAKKSEPAVDQAQPHVEPLPIEVPAPDPGLVLSEPIDSATKLLIDLDEHVQKFLPAEDQQAAQPAKDPVLVAGIDYSPAASASAPQEPSGKSSVPLKPYSSSVSEESIILPILDNVEKSQAAQSAPSPSAGSQAPSSSSSPSAARQGSNNQNQNQQQVIAQLMDQLDSLQKNIQSTIDHLVARRRYVMSALLRPMGTYVRRVRSNLERLQNRVNQLQAAASSVGGNGQNRPGGFVDAAAVETIRRRIDDISKRISEIVNRIRVSLTPTSAPISSNGK